MTEWPGLLRRHDLKPGTLCWTTRRLERPRLLVVLGHCGFNAMVIEVPLVKPSRGADLGLDAALARCRPQTLMTCWRFFLGPKVSHLEEQQLSDLREMLAHHDDDGVV